MDKKRLSMILVALATCIAIGYLFGMDYCVRNTRWTNLYSPLLRVATNKKEISQVSWKIFEGYNGTHLWSMRLADEEHYRLARLMPCRNVSYTGGPKIDQVDGCDYSSNNEFSVTNTIEAQKWLFEHQNPANCSDKNFAIIGNFAWSGFGSVAHQVVWAFGMALAENRIAVYRNPGNWVSLSLEEMNVDQFTLVSIIALHRLSSWQFRLHIFTDQQLHRTEKCRRNSCD